MSFKPSPVLGKADAYFSKHSQNLSKLKSMQSSLKESGASHTAYWDDQAALFQRLSLVAQDLAQKSTQLTDLAKGVDAIRDQYMAIYTQLAKTVAEARAIEGRIQSMGEPADKKKLAEKKKLVAQYTKLCSLAQSLIGSFGLATGTFRAYEDQAGKVVKETAIRKLK